ncbi:hypothetical protein RRG08_053784 [Elysia crispata]|uniref:Uncharacterized protein n=1 Tax=Elysia crispata TaxID=231223 RepID=A0AAE0ZCC9_9GAST|nr:hypothetical protein RRG08_053784 [Elysia crispata]
MDTIPPWRSKEEKAVLEYSLYNHSVGSNGEKFLSIKGHELQHWGYQVTATRAGISNSGPLAADTCYAGVVTQPGLDYKIM